MERPSWVKYYSDIAQQVAKRSNCIKRQVGAVVVLDNRVISTGYNGTPRGVKNCCDGGCRRCNDPTIPSGTQLDTCWCSHAEENAIVQCAYAGVSIKGATLYSMLSPCIQCAKMIIQAGVVEVYYKGSYPQGSSGLLIAGNVSLIETA